MKCSDEFTIEFGHHFGQFGHLVWWVQHLQLTFDFDCGKRGASPPFSYDTLVVNVGPAVKRFREIISFSGQRVYAEYLLAYQRIMI